MIVEINSVVGWRRGSMQFLDQTNIFGPAYSSIRERGREKIKLEMQANRKLYRGFSSSFESVICSFNKYM